MATPSSSPDVEITNKYIKTMNILKYFNIAGYSSLILFICLIVYLFILNKKTYGKYFNMITLLSLIYLMIISLVSVLLIKKYSKKLHNDELNRFGKETKSNGLIGTLGIFIGVFPAIVCVILSIVL
jgi:amino acid permease